MSVTLPILNSSPDPVFTKPSWAEGGKLAYHIMIKPSGSACNLDCTYCFYLHKEQLLDQPKQPRMSEEILERHIRQYIESQEHEEVVFSWQGGEPTLMGLDFFRRVVELQQRYKKPFQRIENDLQTNGTLLDDEWAAFLKQHRFLVGLSMDGPRALHDLYRINKGGAPTFDKVFAAGKLLQKHGVPFNALCVINRENVKRPLDVYRFLTRELGAWRVQFIPCVEPKLFKSCATPKLDPTLLPVLDAPESKPGHPNSIVTDWTVDADDWGAFLCKTWDEWYHRDYGKIHVNHFENAVSIYLGLPAQMCTHAEFCGKNLALEHDGNVYSCDHFVYPEYRMGNIRDTHEGNMVLSERQANFGFDKRDTLPDYCRSCSHLKLCWGECPKNRLLKTPSGQPGLNYLCAGWKKFFSHIQHDMPNILRDLQAAR